MVSTLQTNNQQKKSTKTRIETMQARIRELEEELAESRDTSPSLILTIEEYKETDKRLYLSLLPSSLSLYIYIYISISLYLHICELIYEYTHIPVYFRKSIEIPSKPKPLNTPEEVSPRKNPQITVLRMLQDMNAHSSLSSKRSRETVFQIDPTSHKKIRLVPPSTTDNRPSYSPPINPDVLITPPTAPVLLLTKIPLLVPHLLS